MMNFILKMRMRIGKRKSACNFIKSKINDQSKVARSRRELFTVVIVFVFSFNPQSDILSCSLWLRYEFHSIAVNIVLHFLYYLFTICLSTLNGSDTFSCRLLLHCCYCRYIIHAHSHLHRIELRSVDVVLCISLVIRLSQYKCECVSFEILKLEQQFSNDQLCGFDFASCSNGV